MKKYNEIAVIGAGASGLMAAIFAADEAQKLNKRVKVTLYEANPRVGKKILVTGNGRCNFTNENVSCENFHGEVLLAEKVYSEFDKASVIKFFENMGLYSKSDFAGRVYPLSFQANSVLDALRFEIKRLGIDEVTETKITSLRKQGSGFILNDRYYADKVIVAAGGKASPVQGSDGSGFQLLVKHGIEITELYPALCPMTCFDFPKSLKGIRAQGKITVRSEGKLIAEDTGEIQYTDYGLSGIPSMQVSGAAAYALKHFKSDVYAYVDSCPAFTAEELTEKLSELVKTHPDFPGEMLLSGIMPKKLGMFLLSACSVNPEKKIGILHKGVIEKIVFTVKNKKYRISGLRGFGDAQVTAGGIKGSEINFGTLELKKLHGVYVCGEIVNVHGDCGGYNLQWAWSSGAVAGMNAVREI